MTAERRPWNVGAYKLPHADRDVAHAVLTDTDPRGFFDIIGADDDPTVPLGAPVTYRVELTDAEAERFRGASNCRYVELDGVDHDDVTGLPSASTLAYMRAGFDGADRWHGRDTPVAILDGGISTAVADYMGWTVAARIVLGPDDPGADEVTSAHGCLVAPCGVPAGGIVLDAIVSSDAGARAHSATAAGMRWAADLGVKIVNNSAGGTNPSSTIEDAIVYLADRGVQFYSSAGNDGLNSLSYPAAYSTSYPNVHSSIAFDQVSDTLAAFSNHTADASGCAPGVDVLGMTPDATPVIWNGTSASSPHMALLCARMCTGGTFTAAQAAAALDANTRDTGAPAAEQGGGAYDMAAALTALGALPDSAQPAYRVNLCPNPSVENDSAGYAVAFRRSGIGATNPGRASGVPAASGGVYGFVNVTGDGSTLASTSDVDLALPLCGGVVAGEPHTFSVHARFSLTGAAVEWYVRWEDDAGTDLGVARGGREPLFTSQWTRYHLIATAPAGATRAVPQLWLSGMTDTAARSFRYDALCYEQAAGPGAYFDGDSADAAWDGAPGNSTSTLGAPEQTITPTTIPGPAAPGSPTLTLLTPGLITPATIAAPPDPPGPTVIPEPVLVYPTTIAAPPDPVQGPTLIHVITPPTIPAPPPPGQPIVEQAVRTPLRVDWWAVDEAGDYIPLPDVATWALSPVNGSPGTVSITYPVDGRNFAVLRDSVTVDRDLEVAIWTDGQDIGSLRGLLNTSDGDDVAESSVWSFTGNLLPVRMEEACVAPRTDVVTPPTGPAPTTDLTALRLYAATAGTVMATLMQEAQARGTLTDIVWYFDNTVDSLGTPWSATRTLKIAPGKTHLQVLETLVESQLCEWDVVWNGTDRELVMWETGTRGVDHTVKDEPLILRGGRSLTDSPRKHSVRDAGTHLLLAGGEGLYQEFADPTALARRGRRIERFNSQGSYTDPGSLAAFGQAKLPSVTAGVMEVGHGIALEPGGPRPLLDYRVGDWVFSDTGHGLERLRIAQLTVSGDADGIVAAGLSLNDLIADDLVALSRRVDGIEGGTTVTGTSNPPRDPDAVDTMAPAAPQGVVVDSLAQPSVELIPRAAVTAAWGEVITNADQTAIDDLDGYVVQWRYLDPDLVSNWRQLAPVDTNTATFGDVNAGEPIEVRVAAIDTSGNQSAWSDPSGFATTETDATSPPVPSALTVTEFLGTLTAEWDGLGAAGEPMPADFDEADMYRGTSAVFADAVLVESIAGAGARNFTDLDIGTTYFFWLTAVDRTGNTSAPSAPASGTPALIGYGDIAFNDVGNLVEDGSFELAGSRATHLARSDPGWSMVQAAGADLADHGGWYARGDGSVGTGFRTLVLSGLVPTSPGRTYAYRLALRGTGVNGALSARIRWYDKAGAAIQDNAFGYGPADATGAWLAREVPEYAAPALAESMQIRIEMEDTCTTGTWDVDRVEVREMVGTLLVQNAAITNAKIVSADVGKLTAGTITAIMLMAGMLRSAVTGLRYELDANGLRFYDASGNVAINLDRATASAMLTGTVQTGRTGRRAVLSGAGGELRFYPQVGETRYGRVFSFIPGNYPDDIAVEMRASDSDTTDVIARFQALPDTAFVTVNKSADEVNYRAGLLVTEDRIILSIREGTSSGGTNPYDGGYLILDRSSDTSFFGARALSGQETNVFIEPSGRIGFVINDAVNAEVSRDGVFAKRYHGYGESIDYRASLAAENGPPIIFYHNSGGLQIGNADTGAYIKTFVVDHPTDPARHLVHATTESPHAGVEYWGTAIVEDGQVEVELPPYFEALTRTDGRGVQLTVIAEDDPQDRLKLPRRKPRKVHERVRPGWVRDRIEAALGFDEATRPGPDADAPPGQDPPPGLPSQVQATYPRDGRFTIHALGSVDTFRVSWLVKAIRRDVPELEVEPAKSSGQVRGDGPYTYFVPQRPARRPA